MGDAVDIQTGRLLWGYALLLIPLGLCLWYRLPLVRRTLVGALRMTAQLVFVGLYLDVIFDRHDPRLTLLWLLVMVTVADGSVIRQSGLRLRFFAAELWGAMVLGVGVPAAVFLGLILNRPDVTEPRFLIPIAGMTLGNCLRANIIGLSRCYQEIRGRQRAFTLSLAQGATLAEAVFPFERMALQAALSPTVATMTTIGLVSLPGMMTGVILGGQSPLPAIKYQIAIMLAILSGTALTLAVTFRLARRRCFTAAGCLRPEIFR